MVYVLCFWFALCTKIIIVTTSVSVREIECVCVCVSVWRRPPPATATKRGEGEGRERKKNSHKLLYLCIQSVKVYFKNFSTSIRVERCCIYFCNTSGRAAHTEQPQCNKAACNYCSLWLMLGCKWEICCILLNFHVDPTCNVHAYIKCIILCLLIFSFLFVFTFHRSSADPVLTIGIVYRLTTNV